MCEKIVTNTQHNPIKKRKGRKNMQVVIGQKQATKKDELNKILACARQEATCDSSIYCRYISKIFNVNACDKDQAVACKQLAKILKIRY